MWPWARHLSPQFLHQQAKVNALWKHLRYTPILGITTKKVKVFCLWQNYLLKGSTSRNWNWISRSVNIWLFHLQFLFFKGQNLSHPKNRLPNVLSFLHYGTSKAGKNISAPLHPKPHLQSTPPRAHPPSPFSGDTRGQPRPSPPTPT